MNTRAGGPSLRLFGCVATLALIPLWMSGSLGGALSLDIILSCIVALIGLQIAMPEPRVEGILRITLMIAACSIAVVIADCILRVCGTQLVYYRAHSELIRRDLSYPSLPRYVVNAHSSREIFGDLAAISGTPSHRVFRQEIFNTDSSGFRNSPRELRPPYDLLVLGDSFGMGLGVSQEDQWTALLMKDGLSVYNLSMPATCAAHGAARLSLEIDRLKLSPGAVIIAPVYSGNDVEECDKSVDSLLAEGPQSFWNKTTTAIQDYRSRSPLRQLGMGLVYRYLFSDPVVAVRSVPLIGDVLFYTPHAKAARVAEGDLQRSNNAANLRQGLLRIKALADSHNAKLLVVLVPTKEEIYDWVLNETHPWEGSDSSSGFARTVRSICEENKIDWIDLKPTLVSEAKSSLGRAEILWWRDDSHWNREGHQITARIIKEALIPR